MKKQTKDEQIARLKEKLKQKNYENKKLKQTIKYNKTVKAELKSENKQLKQDVECERKKTSIARKLSSKQHRENLQKRIRERFSEEDSQIVSSELASNFMSELNADSEE